MKTGRLILFFAWFAVTTGIPLNLSSEMNHEDAVMKGPLKISADETVSKEHGRIIEASGKVRVNYEMDSGDTLESFSKFARYDEKAGTGELSGNPKALWKSSDPNRSETTLIADKIFLKIKDSELNAKGNVTVIQAGNTLKADEIAYVNAEKKMTAKGQRPEFDIRDTQHHTKISADEIIAWTDKKQIHFNRKVQGIIELTPENKK